MQNIRHISLTEKEKHVLKLICLEFSSNDIARELNVSLFEINRIRQEIISKIKVKSNIGLLKYAILIGLVDDYVFQSGHTYSLN
jgi:DNA-binding NarL/FixJ family response regulator